MKKVKDWLEDGKKQFIVRDRYASGNIRLVSRIKDDAVFSVGHNSCAVYFKITDFFEDCIHVEVLCYSNATDQHRRVLKCQLNNIKLSDDGSSIVSWEGVNEN